MSELKPCPFCGSKEVRQVEGDEYSWCMNPSCAIYDYEIRINEWNNRAESIELATLREQVKVLRSALENVRLALSENKLITGFCTCGAPIVGHGAWSYHTPKDTGKLVIAEAIAAINLALAKAVK